MGNEELEVSLPKELMHSLLPEIIAYSKRKQRTLRRNRNLSIGAGSVFTAIALISATSTSLPKDASVLDTLAGVIGVFATWVASNNYKMLEEQEAINYNQMQSFYNSIK